MQLHETKHAPRQYSATDKMSYAKQYAQQHNVPLGDIVDTIDLVERQKLMTRAMLAMKKS